MKRRLTKAEVVAVIVVATATAGLFWLQHSNAQLRGQDNLSKQEINTIHHYLEGVYYAERKNYPEKLEAKNLKGLHARTLQDADNIPVNQKDGAYIYTASGCVDGECTGYELTATLVKEASFTKTNLPH